MKNSQEIVNDVDFLSQLLTSNPYAAILIPLQKSDEEFWDITTFYEDI